MNDSRAFADWWSFQMGTIEGWFDRTPETPEDRVIREEGQADEQGISEDRFRPSGRQGVIPMSMIDSSGTTVSIGNQWRRVSHE